LFGHLIFGIDLTFDALQQIFSAHFVRKPAGNILGFSPEKKVMLFGF